MIDGAMFLMMDDGLDDNGCGMTMMCSMAFVWLGGMSSTAADGSSLPEADHIPSLQHLLGRASLVRLACLGIGWSGILSNLKK